MLGTDGTISQGQQIRYLPQKVNRPEGVEMLGQTPTPPRAHMQNFLDCIRTGRHTRTARSKSAIRVSVACSHGDRKLPPDARFYWDPAKEEIV